MTLPLKRYLNYLTAFLGVWAIQLTVGITVRNLLTVVLFVCLFVLKGRIERSSYTGKRSPMKTCLYYLFIIPFALIMARLFYVHASEGFTSSLFKMLTFVILFSGYYSLIDFALRILARVLFRDIFEKKDVEDSDGEGKEWHLCRKNEIMLFVVTFFTCLICYLPYFLYEFPGIMTADSLVQYGQVIGKEPLSNHHPVIHTFLIKFFYEIGMALTGDPIKAISFYTVFQMLFICLCNGLSTVELARIRGNISRKYAILSVAFFAIIPFNAVFAVTMWKDVPFAGIASLLSCKLVEMYRSRKELKIRDFITLSVLFVLFSLFRSNGFYAFVVFIPFLLYFFRENIKGIIGCAFVSLAIVFLIKGPVFESMAVKEPDFTESLSLPLQQVACVLVNDGRVDDNDLEMIDEVVDRTYIDQLYAPNFADNIKELVRAGNPSVIENNKGGYFFLWLRIGAKNPGLYLKAWFDLEGGYVYPDVAYIVGDVDGIMSNSMGLYSAPVIGGKFIKVKEILLKLSDFMPLYGMLFSIGAYFWGLVLCSALSAKKEGLQPVNILMLLVVATLLIAAPLVDFRYGYSYVCTMPLWVAQAFGKKRLE